MYANIPLVFALNKKINTITVNYANGESNVLKNLIGTIGEDSLLHHRYSIDDKIQEEVVVEMKSSDYSLLWKINSSKKNVIDLAEQYLDKTGVGLNKLFCGFPLVGSDSFPFPVIINSFDFKPKEKRNGIGTTSEDTGNRKIIDKSISGYEKFLEILKDNYNDYYLICSTIQNFDNVDWIDVDFMNASLVKIRSIISSKMLLKSMNGKKLLTISNLDKEHAAYFPSKILSNKSGTTTEDSFKQLHNLVSLFYEVNLVSIDEISKWKKVLWANSPHTKIDVKNIVSEVIKYSTISEFRNALESDIYPMASEEINTLDWFRNLYMYLTNFVEGSHLLDTHNGERGIFISRSNELVRKIKTNTDEGWNGRIIDDGLIDIYNELFKCNLRKVLLNENFKEFAGLIESEKKEIEVANQIIKHVQDVSIPRLDKLLRKVSEKEDLSMEELLEKKTLEGTLGKLQVWISKFNDKRSYFEDYFKRRLLQVIIDEKKSVSLVKLIEFNNAGRFTLERQVEILSDDLLERKISIGEKILKQISDKKISDQENSEIGTVYENCIKELFDSLSISYERKDGEQDFIVHTSTDKNIYLEVKSTSTGSDYVELTPDQSYKLVLEKYNYYVCIVQNNTGGKQDILSNAIFVNNLHNSVRNKLFQINSFKQADDGIEGKIPLATLLKEFKEKEYKLKILRNSWEGLDWNRFAKLIQQ